MDRVSHPHSDLRKPFEMRASSAGTPKLKWGVPMPDVGALVKKKVDCRCFVHK